MDEKDGATPIAPVTAYPWSDQESATLQYPEDELRRKKRIRLYTYIAAFAVFQTIIILVFALVVMHVKSPDIEIKSASIENLEVGTSSYNLTLVANLEIKNKNFGDYKYDRTTMTVTHGNVTVGEGVIWKGNAKARDTDKMDVSARVSSNDLADGSGIMMLNCHALLRGKVHLMKMWGIEMQFVNKRKGAKMNCTMAISLTTGVIQNMDCDD